jgi:hypothetical protein
MGKADMVGCVSVPADYDLTARLDSPGSTSEPETVTRAPLDRRSCQDTNYGRRRLYRVSSV